MDFFETVIIIVNFSILGCILFFSEKIKQWSVFILTVAFCVVVVQLIVEGYRWQMIPAYLSPFILTSCYLFAESKKNVKSCGAFTVKTSLLVIYLTIAVMLPSLMPVVLFEKTSGPFKVGTTLYHWIDYNREEPYMKDLNGRRELMVQVWYPAKEKGEMNRAPYIHNSDEIAKGLEKSLSIPAFAFHHLGLMKSNAFMEAQLSDSEERYPVLLFSHGLSGFRNQNTFEVEELASQGYIVVGIDHTYDAAATVFPDGRTAFVQSINLTDFAERDRHIKLWKEDVVFVLNQIEKLNQSDKDNRFTGRMDTSRIGMFGHSYGGATAAQVLVEDSRVKAAINMDGTLYGENVPKSRVGKPFLIMNAETSDDSTKDFLEGKVRSDHALAGGGMSMVIPHTNHTSFTDFHLFSPLLRSLDEDPRYVHRIINEFSLAFFDRYVKQVDDSSALEKLDSKYPEVKFKVN
ncbi:alpha/beta hydrolase family protein [Bacillus cereus]|uniref:alpha/beta hydrolase family protein n=1 Tax=Bacillus cereus TaxID=1396 RepID=UPI000BEB38C2|nr:dienelactone hydrolase family protein [Bacillus cereus]PEE37906.1 carboxylic ester hydrolase [Bacillus cereus]PET45342.1 carboxylic ester hydrolase [Bacillus cereus]PEV74352.1 carboxylic ester hydrolase [Bacillus cereus]PFA49891.1 carboxylic ester hydrolase [Bacillus cereus]PFD80463.1 carboxylic ester hydrolase [Bacillus cereus]